MRITKLIGFALEKAAPAKKYGSKFAYVTDPQQRKAAQNIIDGVKNLTRIASDVAPDEAASIKKISAQFERYGISAGDLKYFTKNDLGISFLADGKVADAILKRKELLKANLVENITEENQKIFIKFLNDKSISDEQLKTVAHLLSEENAPVLKQLLKDKTFNLDLLTSLSRGHLRGDNVEVLKQISKNGKVDVQEMLYIMSFTNKSNSDVAIKLLEKAGDNSKNISSILNTIYAPAGISEESLKAIQLRKNLLSELLENPRFKLGADTKGNENFLISRMLSAVTPENYQIAKAGLIERNVDLYRLSDFLKGVTVENQLVAERILSMASKNTSLPHLKSLNTDVAAKYLDEVSKLDNPKAKSFYIEGMTDLSEDKIDDILQIIRTTKPEDAKHASSLISCVNRGLDKDEAEPLIRMVEQSGRNFSIDEVGNIAVLGACDDVPVSQFLERILNNKSVSDGQIQDLTCRYIKTAQKINDASFTIPRELEQRYQQKLIDSNEFGRLVDEVADSFTQKQEDLIKKLPDIYESLLQNKSLRQFERDEIFSQISVDNADIIQKMVLSPKISKINVALVKPEHLAKIEKLADIGVPKEMQEELFFCLKNAGGNEGKFLEIIPNLLKRDPQLTGKNVREVLSKLDEQTIKYSDAILQREDLSLGQISKLLENIQNSKNPENIMKLIRDKGLKGEYISQVMAEPVFNLYEKNPELVKKALELKLDLQILNPKSSSYFGCGNVAISDVIGEKQLANIINGLEEAKIKYGAIPKKELILKTSANVNDRFLTLSEGVGGCSFVFKFDKKTGKLVSITQPNKSINVSKNKIVEDFVSDETKSLGMAVPYRIDSRISGKNGKYGITYTESAIKGQYDIYHTRPDGSQIRVGHALVTPNGAKHVKRTLTSIDGSKSTLAFREDKLGNSYLHSVVTDKNGQKLSEIKRTFKVISKNHFVSTKDGQAYDIVFTDKNVVVTKLDAAGKKTKENVTFMIKDISIDDANSIMTKLAGLGEDEISKVAGIFKGYGIEPMTIDRSCVDMLKRLPGDEWFVMSKHSQFIMPQSLDPSNASCCGNSIFMSQELADNLGVFCHELGHAKFYALGLGKDKALYKIYNAEKKAFTSNVPESRIEFVDYFLNDNTKASKRGLNELCAETNLVSDTIQTWDNIQGRTIFLEENFPKTIAYLRQKYNTLI